MQQCVDRLERMMTNDKENCFGNPQKATSYSQIISNHLKEILCFGHVMTPEHVAEELCGILLKALGIAKQVSVVLRVKNESTRAN